MTFNSIEAAYAEWRKTLTVMEWPTSKDAFGQGYIAGWNAKELGLIETAFDRLTRLRQLANDLKRNASGGDNSENELALARDIARRIEEIIDGKENT